MSYADQDMFFAEAYKTGQDFWTDLPFNRHAKELMLFVHKGGDVLDVGAGRGHLLNEMNKLGFRVIGLENNQLMVENGNADIKKKHIEHTARFVFGNVLNMPFTDKNFDALIDVGLMHHILPTDFHTYITETTRVLKQGGFFFLAVLSKKTPQYFKWNPSHEKENNYTVAGVHYHFFEEEEIKKLFGKLFDFKKISYDSPFGEKDTTYLIAILQKK